MDNRREISLRPHRQGGKMICPKCGRKSFVPYIYNDTGEIIDPTCGRCDHEQSCGYHLPPAEFFKANPDHNNGRGGFMPYTRPIPTTIDFCGLDEWAARQTADEALESDFARGLVNYFDTEAVKSAISRYHIQSIGRGRNTAFPCISVDGMVTDVMVLGYQADLHRNDVCYHYYGDTAQKEQLKADYPEGYKYDPCYFGEHLLAEQTDKNVAVVESQKSAVICSMLFPDMLWLASCGCGNFNVTKSRVLKDRRVFVYSDKGSSEKWQKVVSELQTIGYNIHLRPIMEDFAEYGANADVVDVIMDNLSNNLAYGITEE